MTVSTGTIALCPICKKPPGQKVGPPAMARCITEGCFGRERAAETIPEWNARCRDVAQPSTGTTDPQFAADAVSDEDLIADAPATLRQLAFRLTELLSDDHWNNIEPMLLDVARLLRRPGGVAQSSTGREPCPFCGSTNNSEELTSAQWPVVECDDCGARGPCIEMGREATNALWNARIPSVAQGLIERGKVRNAALEEAARIAENGCLVPPDGGSPTEDEREMCEGIASAIRVRKLFQPLDPAYGAQVREALALAHTCLMELTDSDPNKYGIAKRRISEALSAVSSTDRQCGLCGGPLPCLTHSQFPSIDQRGHCWCGLHVTLKDQCDRCMKRGAFAVPSTHQQDAAK